MNSKWRLLATSLTASLLISCGGTFQVGVVPPTEAATVEPSQSTGVPPTAISQISATPAPTVDGQTEPAVTVTLAATLPATSLGQPSPTPTNCAPPAKWVPYTVKTGDTLFDLSQQTNTGVQQVREANCLENDIIRTGQQIYLPYIPTPTFTPTATFTPTPPLPTVDPAALWSPNARRYAINAGVVVDIDQRRVASEIANPDSLKVWRWTSDSRYVIFGRKNQFNSTYTYVFDTLAWKLIYGTNGCSIQANSGSLSDMCGDYPFALAVTAPQLLMENGVLVNFDTLNSTDLLSTERPTQWILMLASWSPDGGFVVIAAKDTTGTQNILYLANGNGGAAHKLADLDGAPTDIKWLSNTTASLTVAGQLLTIDAQTGTVTGPPTATPTATLTPTTTATP